MTTEPLLEVRGVAKAFPGVQALDGVSLSVWPGSVHALVGENGAGKSTLMRILAGVYPPDAGELRWDGAPFTLANPAASRALGISTIFQEFTLFPDLSVAENVHVNHEPRARSGRVDWKAMFAATERLLGPLAGGIDVRREVRLLSVAQQQLVEIVKALSVDARLIIMDEPTAALNPTEVSHLFEVITQLKQHGCAVIFISHRLDEVFSIGDVITVLKDGQLVTTQPRDRLTKDEVVRLMVGRSLVETFPAKGTCTEMRPLLRVDKLTTAHVRDVTFTLNAGELLGIAGLEGHGQVQLARALFGLESARSGRIILGGTPVDLRHPAEAIGRGIAFVSDDRKGEGLALMLSVGENVALPNLRRFSQLGVMSAVREERATRAATQAVGVRATSLQQVVESLSGGNQQKVVLAKWLIGDPKVFVFVEPTRGIDVGAKVEVYRLMRAFADHGQGIVMVSSDMLELLGMADRLIVMRDGRIAAEIPGAAATEEAVMRAATGVHEVVQ